MPIALDLDLALIEAGGAIFIAAGGAIFIAAFAISAAAQLFRSAKSADDHVAAGTALGARPPANDGAPVTRKPNAANPLGAVVPPGAVIAPGAVRELIAGADAPRDTAASEQIFAQLNAYYAANISQGNTLFWASLLSMCFGFAIIFFGVIAAGTNGVTAIVAAVAGVLSQFIAATFLVALRSTQQQATTYAQSLVELRLHDVARSADERGTQLGLRLLDDISADGANPANATKASIALGLMVRHGPPIVEPPPVAVEAVKAAEPATERRSRSRLTFDDTSPAQPTQPR